MGKENTSTKKKTTKVEDKKYDTSVLKNSRFLFSILLMITGIALLISFLSYFITGINDQSNLSEFGNRDVEVYNWLGKLGAYLGHVFIYNGFGVASFFLAKLLIQSGIYAFFGIASRRIKKLIFWDLFAMLLVSTFFGFFAEINPLLGGTIGYEINIYLIDYLGTIGAALLIGFIALVFFLFRYKLSPTKIREGVLATPGFLGKIFGGKKDGTKSFDSVDTPNDAQLEKEESRTKGERTFEEEIKIENDLVEAALQREAKVEEIVFETKTATSNLLVDQKMKI